jgi:hypothetical protein
MPVITESQLKSKANYAFGSLGPQTPRPFTRTAAATSIFLSHSSKDKDLALLVKTVLESMGISVYIDWLDAGLPAEVSAETARILRQKIEANRFFLLLGTNNAIDSKWVPWELGYADGKKGETSLAILEVRRDGETFKGCEYFALYQKVTLPGIQAPTLEYHTGANSRNVDAKTWVSR